MPVKLLTLSQAIKQKMPKANYTWHSLLCKVVGWGLLALAILLVVFLLFGNSLARYWQWNWSAYMRNEPTILKVELGADFAEIASLNPQFFTTARDYQAWDSTHTISVMPKGGDSRLCPVQVQYGLTTPIFTLPSSNYMMASFTTGHMSALQVKPMLKPMKREEMQAYVTDLMTQLKSSTGMQWSPETSDVPVMSTEEMVLRMQVRRKDMDIKSFRLGHWESKEGFGIAYILLYVYAFDFEDVPPEEQYYGIQMNIDGGNILQFYLGDLLNYFKEHHALYDARTGRQCFPAGGPCRVADLRDYVAQLKAAGLSPLKKNSTTCPQSTQFD